MRTRIFSALILCLGLGLAAGPARAADPLKRPGDFRDLVWGASPDKVPGLVAVERDGDIVHYERKGEKQELGGIPLRHVTYSFYNNKFYHAEIDYDGKGAYEALQSALVAKYGPPDAVRQKTDQAGHHYELATWNWSGYAFIGNRHDKDGTKGRIFYFYAPLTDALEASRQRADAAKAKGGNTPQGDTYTVQRGDIMARIARRLGVTEEALSAANGGLTDKTLKAGAVLNVPARKQAATEPKTEAPDNTASRPEAAAAKPKAAASYTIQPGDVLSRVAKRHDVSVKDILTANPDLDPKALKPGDTLRIPARH